MSSGLYANASEIYKEGKNSVKGSGSKRTLQGFSTGLVAKAENLRSNDPTLLPEFFLFTEFFGDDEYGDTFVTQQLENSSFSDSVRKQFIVKGIQYQIVWMYVLREFYEALLSCQNGKAMILALIQFNLSLICGNDHRRSKVDRVGRRSCLLHWFNCW